MRRAPENKGFSARHGQAIAGDTACPALAAKAIGCRARGNARLRLRRRGRAVCLWTGGCPGADSTSGCGGQAWPPRRMAMTRTPASATCAMASMSACMAASCPGRIRAADHPPCGLAKAAQGAALPRRTVAWGAQGKRWSRCAGPDAARLAARASLACLLPRSRAHRPGGATQLQGVGHGDHAALAAVADHLEQFQSGQAAHL